MVDFVGEFTELSEHAKFFAGDGQPQRILRRLFGQQWGHLFCIELLVVSTEEFVHNLLNINHVKGKGTSNVDLYSTSLQTQQTTSYLPLLVFPGGATTHICIANACIQLTTHLSTPKRINGWVGHGGWLDRDKFHASGVEPQYSHPSQY